MDYVVMIGQFFLSLCILVVLHEFGHFLPARWFKTRVEKFYLFFDPYFSLIKKKIGETEYGVGWLPLGGYVKISGMIDESMDKEQMAGPPQPWEFRSKPAWQRLIIMLGGVTVNFILGFFLFAMILWYWGEEFIPTSKAQYGIHADALGQKLGLQDGDHILKVGDVDFDRFDRRTIITELALRDAKDITIIREGNEQKLEVPPSAIKELTSQKNKGATIIAPRYPVIIKSVNGESPADQAGLEPNDRIISINGESVEYAHDFVQTWKSEPNKNVNFEVVRNADTLDIALTTSDKGRIGVFWVGPEEMFETVRVRYGFFESLPMGVSQGYNFLADQISAFGKMFTGEINATDSLGGFGSITQLFPKTWDWERFWYITAILSMILGFMNLLPIPALDGGHVMFLLWEVISGKKPSDRFMEIATLIGFVIVIGLVLFANGLDIWRYFQG